MEYFNVVLPVTKVSDDELVAELKAIALRLGKSQISQHDIEKNSRFSYSTYRKHFGSVRTALEKAGLSTSRNWGTPDEEYFTNIVNVWIKLGRQPKYCEMDSPYSKHSASSYRHRFGSWTETLSAFSEWMKSNEFSENEIQNAHNDNQNDSRHNSPRFPNLRLRFQVLKRDNFKCCACGASPARDSSVELHVDHIIPWSKGGKTELNNLQTLCFKCNSGKSNIT